MSTMKIMLDAGHGYNTSGKRCLKSIDPNETREWQLNSRIMDKLGKLLEDYDCEVQRADDTSGNVDVALATRVSLANSWPADLYLSMHHNAGINGGSGGGTIVYHYSDNDTTVALAQKLYDKIVASTGLSGNRATHVSKTAFYVIKNTKMRSYLVENGFMDSTTDTPIILTEDHADKTAQGVLNWLVDDLGLQKKSGSSSTTTTTEEKTAETDPADLAVGAEVIVNGTIYGNGDGSGGSIALSGAHRYIVGYAGANYPNCWGVAKASGGTRQGWAASDILLLVTSDDTSMEDGSSLGYYDIPDYSGTSIVSALDAIKVDSSYAHRKLIAAANDISGYTGTASQNTQMLNLLKAGKLIKA